MSNDRLESKKIAFQKFLIYNKSIKKEQNMTRNLIKKFKLLLQITVLLFQINSCWAEWITYNISDGLVSNDIYTIAIDTSGNIWFGTNGGGISVFDGENNWETRKSTSINSENSIMAGNIIYTIAIDTSGYKWFGTNEGAYLFEGGGEGEDLFKELFKEVKWSSYTQLNSGISADIIEFITVDAFNNKWFGTRGGGASVFEVEEGTWTSYGVADSGIGSNNINTIYIDYTIYPDTPTIWFGTGGGGLSKFEWNVVSNDREWTNYSTSNSGLAESYVMTITIDKYGRKWIGTQRFGVSVLEQDNWFTYDKSNSGLQDNNIKAIVMDDLGAMWIGTGGGGISKFDGNSWATYNTENSGLVSNFVRAIAIDKQGNKWIGTENGVSLFY